VNLDEWNEKSREENGQDAADGMKQEVNSKGKVMHNAHRNERFVILKEEEDYW